MEIVEAPARQRRKETKAKTDPALCVGRQPAFFCQQLQRDTTARHHQCLHDLQIDGGGKQEITGQKQVKNRGHMYRKMRKQGVSLTGGERQTGGFHIMKHLRKNTEIEGGIVMPVIPTNGYRGGENGENAG